MSQTLPLYCPNITCRAFGQPQPWECYEEGECVGGAPVFDHVGLPVNDDNDCGGCGTYVVSEEEFKQARQELNAHRA